MKKNGLLIILFLVFSALLVRAQDEISDSCLRLVEARLFDNISLGIGGNHKVYLEGAYTKRKDADAPVIFIWPADRIEIKTHNQDTCIVFDHSANYLATVFVPSKKLEIKWNVLFRRAQKRIPPQNDYIELPVK